MLYYITICPPNRGSSTFLEILILVSNLFHFMCSRPILSLHRLNVLDRRNPMSTEGQSLRHRILLDINLVYTTKMMTLHKQTLLTKQQISALLWSLYLVILPPPLLSPGQTGDQGEGGAREGHPRPRHQQRRVREPGAKEDMVSVSDEKMHSFFINLSTTSPARGGPLMAATPLVSVSRPNPVPRPEMRIEYICYW